MRRSILTLALFLLLFIAGIAALVSGRAAFAENLLFAHVNVLSTEDGSLLENRFVLVEDGRVTAIRTRDDMTLPQGTRVVESAGQYLMPGLIDMHVHPRGRDDLDAFLVNGVTAIRVARGEHLYQRWRNGIRAGTLRGPRMHISSPYVWDQGPAPWANDPDGVDGMRALVNQYADEGFDSIKLVDSYEKAETEALMESAKARGLRVFGHVPDDTEPFDWEWTASLGMWSHEHLDETVIFALGQEPTEEEIDAYVDIAKKNGAAFSTLFGSWVRNNERVDRILAGGPVYLPEQLDRAKDIRGADGLNNLMQAEGRFKDASEEDLRKMYRGGDVVFRVLRRLVAAGVPVVPGTEGGANAFRAGESLLMELDIMENAGLTRAQVLKAATADAADLLAMDGVSGRVAEGTAGDFILLGANPLEDLGALKELQGVLVDDRWYSAAELAQIRAAL